MRRLRSFVWVAPSRQSKRQRVFVAVVSILVGMGLILLVAGHTILVMSYLLRRYLGVALIRPPFSAPGEALEMQLCVMTFWIMGLALVALGVREIAAVRRAKRQQT